MGFIYHFYLRVPISITTDYYYFSQREKQEDNADPWQPPSWMQTHLYYPHLHWLLFIKFACLITIICVRKVMPFFILVVAHWNHRDNKLRSTFGPHTHIILIDCGAGTRSGCSDFTRHRFTLIDMSVPCKFFIITGRRIFHIHIAIYTHFFGELNTHNSPPSPSRSEKFIYLIRCTSFIKVAMTKRAVGRWCLGSQDLFNRMAGTQMHCIPKQTGSDAR